MFRTLIVEDNATFRESFREVLCSRFPSMDILEAKDGEEALHQIKAAPPDLVFMDIKLPGENGLSLTRKIKGEFPHIVVVILTSYDLPEYREAAFQYQANFFVVKGASSSEILDTVDSIVSASGKES